MRTKDEILNQLQCHKDKLDGYQFELASVAMLETEIQIDIRDILSSKSDNLKAAEIDNKTVKMMQADKE